MKNYVKGKPGILKRMFYCSFAYLDIREYAADRLFVDNKVRVYYKNLEAAVRDSDYILVFCKIKKRDEKAFLDALSKLPNKMLLIGHTDYEEWCNTVFNIILKGGEHYE